ncbi:MAG: tRNA pseudouridine(38-40) synthase TruA [Akkermansiaceae bacterium]
MRLKMTIAYDGRPYEGWATQPTGNTVQDYLEQAAGEVAKQSVRVHGSGRTDTGVHALGQVAHMDVPDELRMNAYNWVPAMNNQLPPTIRVMDCSEMPREFHARYDALSKTYTYDLSLEPVLPPHTAGLAWHLPRQLDAESLDNALALFVGEHCFRAFAAKRGNETEGTDYVRIISKSELASTAGGYRITFTGNGFLYKMVRLLTGAAVYVAQGRLRLDDLSAMLDQEAGLAHGRSPYCAPPDGLTLHHVTYSGS